MGAVFITKNPTENYYTTHKHTKYIEEMPFSYVIEEKVSPTQSIAIVWDQILYKSNH